MTAKEKSTQSSLKRRGLILSVSLFILLIATWEFAIWVADLSPLVLPTPAKVLELLVEIFVTGYVMKHLWITLAEILLGFVVGSVLGIVLGTAVAHSPLLRQAMNPYIIASQAMPKLALAPIFILWFGFGLTPKVVITALIAFFPLFENAVTALSDSDPQKLELFRSLQATPRQIFFMLKVPEALPMLFAGLKVAMVLSVVGAIIGEFVGSRGGLGALIIAAQGTMDTPLMFAVFVVLTVLGMLLYSVVGWTEQVVLARRFRR